MNLTNGRTIVILEPDGLADFGCMSAAQLAARLELLNNGNGNGNGDNGQWCNPGRRKLGKRSTADPAALELWINDPGNSDGMCGVAPTTKAGVFGPAIAQRLIAGT